MKSISITAFNRPKYLKRVVDSILENDTSGFTHCFCSIEPDMAEENIKEIVRLQDRFPVCECNVNAERQGVRQNPYNLLTRVFMDQKISFNLYLEDDSFLSPDAFDFVNFYLTNYQHTDIMCCNLYNYQSSKQFPKNVEFVSDFCALGFGITRGQWQSWFEPFWFDEDIRIRNKVDMGGIGGWDWSIRAVMKEFNLKVVAPKLSRAFHIGINGIHCDLGTYNAQFRDHPYSQEKIGGFVK